MKKPVSIICFIFIAGLAFADDKNRPPVPRPPAEPSRPVVPGVPGAGTVTPQFPPPPRPPDRNDQSNNGQVREIEKYDLIISEAFPNGNTRNNAANAINNAQYTLYSNRTITLKLFFKDGSEYVYHLRNPRVKIETSAGAFRETFDTVVQAGRDFLIEQYVSELSYNENTITSLNVMRDNRVILLLNFHKKT